MGLIKAGIGAIGGTLADQWKEFFCCDSLDKDILCIKGQKRIGNRSSNTRGSDNVISNGSGIIVSDGQCMVIVEQGRVVEICAEPGEYTFDTKLSPSIFTGKLSESVKATFKDMWERFKYGGEPARDQRVYYFNIKEIIDNKFGTPNPIPFRVVDNKIGLDIDVSLRCSGVYSYKISDPILFYTNVCGNISDEYSREEIDNQLKTEFISALQPALAKISESEIRPSALPAHVEQLSDAMNQALTKKWAELRGLSVVSIAMNPINLTDEDQDLIKNAQRAGMLRNPAMAAGTIAGAQADAMVAAANNQNGAMGAFMGMGMAQNAGGVNAQSLYGMAVQNTQNVQTASTAPSGDLWRCECGNTASGNFCPECGSSKPTNEWKCECGTVNKGKFCSECGKKKPSGELLYRCNKCGWEPNDPKNPPKYCPECGDVFDDKDIK